MIDSCFSIDIIYITNLLYKDKKGFYMLFSEEIQNDFVKHVEKVVLGGELGYIDAVLESCEQFDVEPVIAAKFLPQPIKEKLEAEGREYNMFPKNTSKLPI
jgi:hypothetical protein